MTPLRIALATVLTTVLATALTGVLPGTAGVTRADPPTTPPSTDIVAVAGDTVGPLLDQLASDYDALSPTPSRKLWSYGQTGSATITPKLGCSAVTRPSGSLASVNLLKPPTNPTLSHCVDFAGASRPPTSADAGLAFVQYALDAVTWSKTSRAGAPSHAPVSLSPLELRAIYTCNASLLGTDASGQVRWNQVGGTSTNAVVPVLPEANSGTRSFFLSAIGVTTPGSCVLTTTPLDNEGTAAIFGSSLSPDIVFPYSVADYLAQSQNGHGTGTQGNQVLGSAERGSAVLSPTVGNPGSLMINPALGTVALTRYVYNAVRDTGTSQHVPPYLQPLLGAGNDTGWLCTNTTAQQRIVSYGFRPLGSGCGYPHIYQP